MHFNIAHLILYIFNKLVGGKMRKSRINSAPQAVFAMEPNATFPVRLLLGEFSLRACRSGKRDMEAKIPS